MLNNIKLIFLSISLKIEEIAQLNSNDQNRKKLSIEPFQRNKLNITCKNARSLHFRYIYYLSEVKNYEENLFNIFFNKIKFYNSLMLLSHNIMVNSYLVLYVLPVWISLRTSLLSVTKDLVG